MQMHFPSSLALIGLVTSVTATTPPVATAFESPLNPNVQTNCATTVNCETKTTVTTTELVPTGSPCPTGCPPCDCPDEGTITRTVPVTVTVTSTAEWRVTPKSRIRDRAQLILSEIALLLQGPPIWLTK
jgi:hypothetical protein